MLLYWCTHEACIRIHFRCRWGNLDNGSIQLVCVTFLGNGEYIVINVLDREIGILCINGSPECVCTACSLVAVELVPRVCDLYSPCQVHGSIGCLVFGYVFRQ